MNEAIFFPIGMNHFRTTHSDCNFDTLAKGGQKIENASSR